MLTTSNTRDFSLNRSPSRRSYTFSHFLRRKPRPLERSYEPPPPPLPPKDRSPGHYYTYSQINRDSASRSASLDSNVSYHSYVSPGGAVHPPVPPPKPSASLPPPPMTAAERAKFREEAKRRREQQEREMALEENARQARSLRQKQKMELEAAHLEERRKEQLANDLERARYERAKKEQLQRAEEERAHKLAEERKLQAKQRRLKEGRRMLEWREEQERRRQQLQKEEEEESRRHQQEWLQRLKAAGDSITESSAREGWVTIQTSPATPWRRRWYKFVGHTVFFYRSPQDKHTSLDTLHLAQYSLLTLRHSRDPGYEELQAIDHSFALEFDPVPVGDDDSHYWCFFADTEEAKDDLLGLFCYFGDISPETVAQSSFVSKIPRWKDYQQQSTY